MKNFINLRLKQIKNDIKKRKRENQIKIKRIIKNY